MKKRNFRQEPGLDGETIKSKKKQAKRLKSGEGGPAPFADDEAFWKWTLGRALTPEERKVWKKIEKAICSNLLGGKA